MSFTGPAYAPPPRPENCEGGGGVLQRQSGCSLGGETTDVYSRTTESMASPVSLIPDPSLLLLRHFWRTRHKRNNSCVSGPDYGPQVPWHSPDFQSSVPMPHLDQTMCPDSRLENMAGISPSHTDPVDLSRIISSTT